MILALDYTVAYRRPIALLHVCVVTSTMGIRCYRFFWILIKIMRKIMQHLLFRVKTGTMYNTGICVGCIVKPMFHPSHFIDRIGISFHFYF